MSNVIDFLSLPDVAGMTETITVGRLGELVVKPMTESDWGAYHKRCAGSVKKGGMGFDTAKFNLLVVAGQVVSPDFADAAFLKKAGCGTAEEFISKKLMAGEIAGIAERVIELSGFNGINEDIEAAKN